MNEKKYILRKFIDDCERLPKEINLYLLDSIEHESIALKGYPVSYEFNMKTILKFYYFIYQIKTIDSSDFLLHHEYLYLLHFFIRVKNKHSESLINTLFMGLKISDNYFLDMFNSYKTDIIELYGKYCILYNNIENYTEEDFWFNQRLNTSENSEILVNIIMCKYLSFFIVNLDDDKLTKFFIYALLHSDYLTLNYFHENKLIKMNENIIKTFNIICCTSNFYLFWFYHHYKILFLNYINEKENKNEIIMSILKHNISMSNILSFKILYSLFTVLDKNIKDELIDFCNGIINRIIHDESLDDELKETHIYKYNSIKKYLRNV